MGHPHGSARTVVTPALALNSIQVFQRTVALEGSERQATKRLSEVPCKAG